MKEIYKANVEIENLPLEIKCKKCHENITLWFNGGELDEAECCGYKYSLQHEKIVFIIEK